MSRVESITNFRREGESIAQARERLRAVVEHADDLAFAARFRRAPDGGAILSLAVAVFGSRGAARAWLCKPALGLGSYSAFELLDTPEGRQRVLELLGRLEAGLYS